MYLFYLVSNLAWKLPHAGCQLTRRKLFTTLDKVMFLWYIIVMKPRNIISNEGGEPFTVHQHIILKNFWEYYLGKTKDNVAFGYVMGLENEWGSVYMPEIEPYILSKTTGSCLNDIMPPEGYYWENEKEIALSA